MSKIQNETKSQLPTRSIRLAAGCLSVCQRYKMKPNHNINSFANSSLAVVYQYVKDTK